MNLKWSPTRICFHVIEPRHIGSHFLHCFKEVRTPVCCLFLVSVNTGNAEVDFSTCIKRNKLETTLECWKSIPLSANPVEFSTSTEAKYKIMLVSESEYVPGSSEKGREVFLTYSNAESLTPHASRLPTTDLYLFAVRVWWSWITRLYKPGLLYSFLKGLLLRYLPCRADYPL